MLSLTRNNMKICLINFDAVWKDKKKNIAKKDVLIQKAISYHSDTDIIIFPELSLTGYVLDQDAHTLAEDRDDEGIQTMCEIAKRYHVALIFWFIEQNPHGKPYNSVVLIGKDGEVITTYRKNHLFSQGVEPTIYTPGDTLSVFEFEWVKCGLSICFDLRYPRLYEAYKKAWVECIFTSAAWVDARNKPDIFHSLTKARSGENQIFMASVDCIWDDENNQYAGNVIISNPYCEDIRETKDDIFHFAVIDRDIISNLSEKMPLSSGYKDTYSFS
jgi:omega-amidase